MHIVDKASFTIFDTEKSLKKQLLDIEKAGRICYRSEEKEITEESASKFIRTLIKHGHESVIEHSKITVLFLGVSRGFTHELVRHRLGSVSQESTRYVDYAKNSQSLDLGKVQLNCILPPHRNPNKKYFVNNILGKMSAKGMLSIIEQFYRALRLGGWVPEDARQVLPNALNANIIFTTNFREWRHIFEMRTQKAAHWEIRATMCNLLEYLKTIIPIIFEDFIEAGVDENGLRYFKKIGLE